MHKEKDLKKLENYLRAPFKDLKNGPELDPDPFKNLNCLETYFSTTVRDPFKYILGFLAGRKERENISSRPYSAQDLNTDHTTLFKKCIFRIWIGVNLSAEICLTKSHISVTNWATEVLLSLFVYKLYAKQQF